jgi:mono/diheme cytochrome c family protein
MKSPRRTLRVFVAWVCVAVGAVILVWLGFNMAARQQAPPRSTGATQQPSVERGEYLVHVANCVSCHTAKAGVPFGGGRAFRTNYGLFGDIYSSNITADRDTGLGSWTEEDFIKAMRSGIAPGGRRLFPAFPYTAFTKLATSDIRSIYIYLRTLPAVHSAPPENSFWFRQRWAMRIWNALFFEEGELAPDPSKSTAWNDGQYLVEALGHCSACHTPRNLMLAERSAAQYTGGTNLDEVEPGKVRAWSAPNLTSAPFGLAKWSVEDLQKYLKLGNSRRAGILGPMNEVVANSLRYLTGDDAAAMATYIKSLPANGASSQQTPSADERAAGQALYDKHCEECHLSTGRGGFRKAPAVAGSSIVQTQNPASLINVMLYGAKQAAGIPSALDAWEDMPGFKDKMSNAEIARLANFLRSSWGNQGGQVSAGSVAAQR